ncbi:hypothetical protein [Leifsonia sp. RAF41]|uniref:hypothetical protein n=1 Tax=Leifsonia sp. RAF41 TaxID=3233056 RepID=UPI003F96582C
MDLRAWLVVATIAGFLITLGGLVAAWVSARREYADAQRRIDKMKELGEAEKAENDAIAADPSHPRRAVPADQRNAEWTAKFTEHDLVRASWGNLSFIAAYESRRLLGVVLKSTGREFVVAAFGLLISTAASVGSLFLTS